VQNATAARRANASPFETSLAPANFRTFRNLRETAWMFRPIKYRNCLDFSEMRESAFVAPVLQTSCRACGSEIPKRDVSRNQ
jgi:hypothetical protein